jgi:hypothetical protein
MKYLGTAVAARRNVKLQSMTSKFNDMKILVDKIMHSPLSTVQKIDAVKTFVIPRFDFPMLNGEVGKVQLDKMDEFIRGRLDKLLKIPGLPIACHHMSWRDGGLGYPSLADRRNVLRIRSFTQLLLSNDSKIRNLMQEFIESEREYRKIPIETDLLTPFLNWKSETGQSGTSSIVNGARRAVRELEVEFHIEADNMILIKNKEFELKTKTPAHVGQFLTQKVIRPAKAIEMSQWKLKGASFATFYKNTCSNQFLRNIRSHRSDAFFRFTIAGRTDSLPTPANIQRWHEDCPPECCRKCKKGVPPTFAHILNGCLIDRPNMTLRHDRVVKVVKRALDKHILADLVGPINLDMKIPIEGLSEETRRQRPDIWFTRNDGNRKVYEIIEISCPYGRTSDKKGDTLKYTFDYKKGKYQGLANEIKTLTGLQTKVYPIIVSSMGAVYFESLTCLKSILRCSDTELLKIGNWMSEEAILGSLQLWINYQSLKDHTHIYKEIAEEELAQHTVVEEIDENEENDDEDDENEKVEIDQEPHNASQVTEPLEEQETEVPISEAI